MNRILKYDITLNFPKIKIFGKGYALNCFEETFLKFCFEIKTVKDAETSTLSLKIFMEKHLLELKKG